MSKRDRIKSMYRGLSHAVGKGARAVKNKVSRMSDKSLGRIGTAAAAATAYKLSGVGGIVNKTTRTAYEALAAAKGVTNALAGPTSSQNIELIKRHRELLNRESISNYLINIENRPYSDNIKDAESVLQGTIGQANPPGFTSEPVKKATSLREAIIQKAREFTQGKETAEITSSEGYRQKSNQIDKAIKDAIISRREYNIEINQILKELDKKGTISRGKLNELEKLTKKSLEATELIDKAHGLSPNEIANSSERYNAVIKETKREGYGGDFYAKAAGYTGEGVGLLAAYLLARRYLGKPIDWTIGTTRKIGGSLTNLFTRSKKDRKKGLEDIADEDKGIGSDGVDVVIISLAALFIISSIRITGMAIAESPNPPIYQSNWMVIPAMLLLITGIFMIRKVFKQK